MTLEGGPAAEKRWRMVDQRNLIEAIWPGTGVLMEDDFTVAPAAPESGHAVTITPGRAVAHGAAFRQGGYFAWSDSVETLVWPGPDAQPRVDTLLLQWFDPSMGTVSRPAGPDWLIVPGQPSATPVARSDEAIASTWSEPGAYLIGYDVQIIPGQTAIAPENITRRFQALTSRSASSRMKMPTSASTAFRNWAAENPAVRKAFPVQYWDPVTVMVPYTGMIKVTITGKTYNSSSPNAGVSFCYALSGANSSGLSTYADWEYLVRGQYNQTSSTTQLIRGLTPGLTTVTPNLWVSETTVPTGVSLTSGELLVEPVY